MTRTRLLTLVISAGGCVGALGQVSDPGPVRPILPPEISEARESELLRSCAGTYRESAPFRSTRLTIVETGRFEWQRWTCTSSDKYEGFFSEIAGELVPTVETHAGCTCGDEADAHALPELLPVPWSGRHYLVESNQLRPFCNAVNAGREPVQGDEWSNSLLRDGDADLEIQGSPEVPASARGWLLHEPIVGRVVDVSSDGRATLSFGRRVGLQPGMEVGRHLQPNDDWAVPEGGPWYFTSKLIVETVDEETATTEPPRWIAPPRAGQPVTGLLREDELPLAAWREAGDDTHLTYEPLPPVLGATPAQLVAWTTSIRNTFSPGVDLAALWPAPQDWADALTPAFLNSLRGLDMVEPVDVATARAILSVWEAYLSRAGGLRRQHIDCELPTSWDEIAAARKRITAIETYVMWWREMSADPERFETYRYIKKR